jgi:hypothetical protein
MIDHVLAPCPGPLPGRFQVDGDLVTDGLTGLIWPRGANPLGFPLPWREALDAAADLGRRSFLGRNDWRVPNRRELRSLIDHGRRNPALPEGHPFAGVFLGWCWTSTTKAGLPAYAWNVHLEGGRTFYSRKDEERLLWPVAGLSAVLPRTGQTACFAADGRDAPCAEDGQDGALRLGAPWPEPRFVRHGGAVRDRLTGLEWLAPEALPADVTDWDGSLALAAGRGSGWRLPDINELESLVDAAQADPALPEGLDGAAGVTAEGFWSATTSGFDTAWAFVLYAQKGAVGVGFKAKREFRAWPVRG